MRRDLVPLAGVPRPCDRRCPVLRVGHVAALPRCPLADRCRGALRGRRPCCSGRWSMRPLDLLKPGGVLVYSVCTLTDAEGPGVAAHLAGGRSLRGPGGSRRRAVGDRRDTSATASCRTSATPTACTCSGCGSRARTPVVSRRQRSGSGDPEPKGWTMSLLHRIRDHDHWDVDDGEPSARRCRRRRSGRPKRGGRATSRVTSRGGHRPRRHRHHHGSAPGRSRPGS